MIGVIEQGIIDRIKAASDAGALGYRLRTVESYGGQLDAATVKEVVRIMPACLVTFAGEPRPEEIAAGVWRYRPTFSVLVVVANRRNDAARRHGDGATPGSYQLLTDVRAVLTGSDLGLDIVPLQPGAVRSVVNGRIDSQPISIYAHEFATAYDVEADAAPSGLDDFATFHADWDLPPHGNVSAPLPAEDADTADTLTLPIQGEP